MRNQVYCINFCLIIFIKHCLEHLYVHMCVLFHRESTELSITTTQHFTLYKTHYNYDLVKLLLLGFEEHLFTKRMQNLNRTLKSSNFKEK